MGIDYGRRRLCASNIRNVMGFPSLSIDFRRKWLISDGNGPFSTKMVEFPRKVQIFGENRPNFGATAILMADLEPLPDARQSADLGDDGRFSTKMADLGWKWPIFD